MINSHKTQQKSVLFSKFLQLSGEEPQGENQTFSREGVPLTFLRTTFTIIVTILFAFRPLHLWSVMRGPALKCSGWKEQILHMILTKRPRRDVPPKRFFAKECAAQNKRKEFRIFCKFEARQIHNQPSIISLLSNLSLLLLYILHHCYLSPFVLMTCCHLEYIVQ